jgi:SH3-like domain-containing protein
MPLFSWRHTSVTASGRGTIICQKGVRVEVEKKLQSTISVKNSIALYDSTISKPVANLESATTFQIQPCNGDWEKVLRQTTTFSSQS